MDTYITNKPRVSIIMSVYNTERFLHAAIDSILTQTYQDFEFIIIDDCSTDNTNTILQTYTDPRIKTIKNDINIGLALSLNKAIDATSGTYLIRMDGDDIALPKRIEKQVAFMDNHPKVGISGAYAQTFGAKNTTIMRQPTDPEELKVNLLFRTSLIHPTVIMRKEFLDKNNLRYRNAADGVAYVEDYDLWTRAARCGTLANLPETLLLYRRHDKQASIEHKDIEIHKGKDIIARQLENLGLSPTDQELDTAMALKRYLFMDQNNFPMQLENLFVKIYTANSTKHIYTEAALEKVFGQFWLEMALAYRAHGKDIWKEFWNGLPRHWIVWNFRNVVRLLKLYI